MSGRALEILALMGITGTDDETFEPLNVIGLLRDSVPSKFTDDGIIRQDLNGDNDVRQRRAGSTTALHR